MSDNEENKSSWLDKDGNEQRIREAYRLIDQIGVQMTIETRSGTVGISEDTLILTLREGIDALEAKMERVSVDHWRKWWNFMQEDCQQCTGETREGKRCRNMASYHRVQGFVWGVHDRCNLHGPFVKSLKE